MGATLKSIIMCFLMSMVPLLELRFALPAGITMGIEPWIVFVVCVAGNLVPVPFIMLFIRRLFKFMESRGGVLAKVSNWILAKAHKDVGIYYKYSIIGLCIFTAIPLPGTGAWSAALIASVLDLRMRNALPAIAVGVIIAGLIMLAGTFGVLGLVGHIS